MSSDKPHVNLLVDEQYDGYYPIVITLYVEHIAVVANIIHHIERLLDVSKIIPVCLGRSPVPVTKRHVCICMFCNKISDDGE